MKFKKRTEIFSIIDISIMLIMLVINSHVCGPDILLVHYDACRWHKTTKIECISLEVGQHGVSLEILTSFAHNSHAGYAG